MNVIDLAPDNAWEDGADGYIIKYGQGGLEYDWRPHVARAIARGKPYGGYWVVDSRYRAESHKAVIKSCFPTGAFGPLGLWLDIEKPNINMTDEQYLATPYHGWRQVDSVWEGVGAYTGVYPGMYLSPGSWDLIMAGVPLENQIKYAALCELWLAHHYAINPLMRGKWTRWALWQWRGEPDYNNVNLDWWASKGFSVPVPGDIVTCPLPGVKVTRGRRFNSDTFVIEVERAAIAEASIEKPAGRRLVDGIAGDIVTNGGDFDMVTGVPVGLLTSHGVQYAPQADAEPALGFDADNTAQITHTRNNWPNAVGLKRYLVVNGALSPNHSAAWDERHPRNIQGVKANGDLVLYQCKGRQPDQAGHTLYESAAVMLEFGAHTAADGDGGESVQARAGSEFFQGTVTRRLVADFIAIKIKNGGGQTMPSYKCTVIWGSGCSIRMAPTTSDANANPLYPAGFVFTASELVPDRDDPANLSKQWAKIASDPMNGTRYAGRYVAVKYPSSSGSFLRATVEEIPVEPPPPPPASTVDHIVIYYTDGTEQRFVPA